MIVTPGGRRHESVVHQVDPDHIVVLTNERLEKRDEAGRSFDLGAAPIASGPTSPDTTIGTRTGDEIGSLMSRPAFNRGWLHEGWITFAKWFNEAGPQITSFQATWTVPPTPSTFSNQTIFLFNGLRDASDEEMILQPVLQWGSSDGGAGGAFWSIASWYIGATGYTGPACCSSSIPVQEGDVLTGEITATSGAGSTAAYSCQFVGVPETKLTIGGAPVLRYAVVALEAYGINRCSDYPAVGYTRFFDIGVQTGVSYPLVEWVPRTHIADCEQETEILIETNPGAVIDLFY
jgi:hypothetical protein